MDEHWRSSPSGLPRGGSTLTIKILRIATLLFAAAGFLSAQTLTPDKTSLTFTAQTNGAPPSPQTVVITSNAGNLGFTLLSSISWLTVSPTIGQTPATVTVSVNPQGLAPNTYTGTITVAGGQGPAPVITVTFNVGSIGVNPSSLQFNYQQGTGATPPAQSVALSGLPTNYSATATSTP